MKIQPFVADTTLPLVPRPSASPAGYAANVPSAPPVIGGRVVGGFYADTRQPGKLGAQLNLVAGAMLDAQGKIDEAIAQQDRTTRVTGLVIDAAQQMEDAEQRLKHDPGVDHTTFPASVEGAFGAIRQGVLDRTTDPLTKAAVAAKLGSLTLERTIEARRYANRLFVAKEQATTEDYLSILARKAAADPDPLRAQWYEDQAQTFLLEKRGGVYTDQQIGTMQRAFVEHTTTIRAQQAIHAGVFDPADYERKVSPEKMEVLVRQNEIETRQRRVDADRLAARAEQEWEKARKATLVTLEQDALAGRLTLSTLDRYAAMRAFETPEEYRRLHALITSPKEVPSDPATLKRLELGVLRQRPTVSDRDLDAAYDSGKLSTADYRSLKGTYVARLDHAETQGRTILGQRHAQAEQELYKGLGIPTLYDKLDHETDQLLLLGLQELTDRSTYYRGKEDPLVVVRGFLTHVEPVREKTLALSIDALRAAIGYPTREALEADRARLGEVAYFSKLKLFSDLDKKLRGRPTMPPPAPGAAKPLRTPSTPTKTGRDG